MSEKVFRHLHRVTYAECTVGNHIYYARYLDLLEGARGEFFRQAGIPFSQLQNEGFIFPVVEAHLRYRAPARYDDVVGIEIWLSRLRGVRLNFGYRVLNEASDTLLLEGETWHVCTGLDEKPKRIPEKLIERLQPYFRESVAES